MPFIWNKTHKSATNWNEVTWWVQTTKHEPGHQHKSNLVNLIPQKQKTGSVEKKSIVQVKRPKYEEEVNQVHFVAKDSSLCWEAAISFGMHARVLRYSSRQPVTLFTWNSARQRSTRNTPFHSVNTQTKVNCFANSLFWFHNKIRSPDKGSTGA